MINKHFEYEKEVIDPILNLIKDNQIYLTKKENLPQLAKLGYMYNTLWYAGRVCWGYNGILRGDAKRLVIDGDDERNYNDCEDDPKYKIEMCDPINDNIDDFIYDAWGMHIEMEETGTSFEEFVKIIREGKKLSANEIKRLKINKTFEDWVEILTDKEYRYSSIYPNKRAVASHLLCTIGNGYGINKDGFIIEEASGADQDEALYGDWQNAIFREDIRAVVEKILNFPETKASLDADCEKRQKYIKEREDKDKERQKNDDKINDFFYDILKKAGLYKADLYDRINKYVEIEEAKIIAKGGEIQKKSIKIDKKAEKRSEYRAYYPISSTSIIYAIADKETQDRLKIKSFDPSYVNASIEICKEIIANEEIENKAHHGTNNVNFAKKFLLKQGFTEYFDQVPVEIDKYALEKKVLKALKPFTDFFNKSNITNLADLKIGEYYYNFNNTKKNTYGDNSYNFTVNVDTEGLPTGNFCSLQCLEGCVPYYEVLKDGLEKISKFEGIETIKFYFDNPIIKSKRNFIVIRLLRRDENYTLKFEDYLIENGFQVGENTLTFRLNDDIVLSTHKPTPLGEKHPDSRPGKWDIFSTNKQFDVLNNNGKKLCNFNIDERRGNYIYTNGTKTDLAKWFLAKHAELKASNPEYGTFEMGPKERTGKDGKISLTAHDFFMWLKNNQ